MIYGVYSMRDVKTGFMQPTLEQNDDAAARSFYHAVSTSEGILFTYASDFFLFKIGEFDTDSGSLIPCVPVVQVADGAHALDVIRKENKNA